MVKQETFILVSLEEEKSKKLAQVIANETSRKILDYLGKKQEATESEIAKELNLPLSTIHYNIQQLLKTNLIESKEFVWSEKGKEVNIYTIAKKLIVIAPSSTKVLRTQLKKIIPVTLISLVATSVVYLFTKSNARTFSLAKSTALTQEIAEQTTAPLLVQQTNPAIWFLYGALFAIFIFIFWNILRREKE